jgi:lipopolysaccharide transport system permease protein
MAATLHHLTAILRLPRTILRHRYLLGQLAWRAFASRHAGSYLGWLWTPVATAVQFVLFMVVFSAILKIKVVGLGIDLARMPEVGFGVFLITGLVPYLAINDTVLRSARVFRTHANLVQRVRMPAEVLVLGDTLGALLHHAMSFALVVLYCLWRGHLTVSGLPWVAAGLTLILLWIVGLSLVVSLLGAVLPDLAEAMGLVLQVVFYAAPIVYPLALVPTAVVRTAIELNPLTPMVGVMRTGLVGAAPPAAPSLIYLVLVGVAVLVVGAAALDRWRASIADLV